METLVSADSVRGQDIGVKDIHATQIKAAFGKLPNRLGRDQRRVGGLFAGQGVPTQIAVSDK